MKDNGIGIEKRDLPRIFERFYKVEKSRAGIMVSGSGLGLPIALEIIQIHNGSIVVESVSRQGSVFMVKIPLVYLEETNSRIKFLS